MKLSCLPVSLFPAIMSDQISIKEYARLCKSLDLDGFDLGMALIKNHTPVYINSLKKDIEEAAIPLTMITTYPDFTHPEARQREREFEYLRHDIAIASALGAKFLRITAGQAHPEMPVDRGIELVVSYFQRIAPHAENYEVKLVYEDHAKPGAWDYIDFSNPPQIFLRIAELIKDTGIGINFDTANILASGENKTLEVLEKVIDNVETIHVAETGTMGRSDPVLLGTGIVPFSEIFAMLKKYNWDKWLCIEEFSNLGIEGVKKAVEFTRKTWNDA